MRLGIFGGTFNPPHMGHIRLVTAIADKLQLDRVLIIPASVPPHKHVLNLARSRDRFEMCRLSFEGDRRFSVSDTELLRVGKSYTYDTLCEIKKKYPDAELFLIVGSDMLATFDEWYRYHDILMMCTLCAGGDREDKIHRDPRFRGQLDTYPPQALRAREHSGTYIRQGARLYRTKGALHLNVPEKYREYDELLKSKLDEYRYIHSLGVAKSARHLAELYGSDPEKAYFAGLMHDVMKNAAPEEQLQMIKKADIILSSSERLNRKLWHAIAGAAFLKLELNITDPDIIGAVRWHTTGKAGMTKLEKTVYLADFISADRKYPDVDKVRELAEHSLEGAMLYTQRYCISKLLADGMIIDPSSVDCYNELITERSSEK